VPLDGGRRGCNNPRELKTATKARLDQETASPELARQDSTKARENKATTRPDKARQLAQQDETKGKERREKTTRRGETTRER
jgi:hypothetical protein